MCYQHEVRKRRIPFQEDKETLEKIEKAAKWLTGDYKVGLLLYGIVGSGKSTLGKAICNLIGILHNSSISSERKGVFRVSALDLAKNVANDPMYFNKLKNQELLFIDDIFDFKVQPNPKAEIVQEALDVAGVTKEQILSYPAMGYVYGQFTAILNKYVDKYNKQDKFFLAGYNNASFDNQFLRAWFLQNGDKYFGSYFWSNSIDVMVLATPYLASQRSQMENFKQGTVAKALGIEIDESRLHDALYDIQVCKSIYDIVSPYKM